MKSLGDARYMLALTLGACLGLVGCSVDASSGDEGGNEGQQEANTSDSALTGNLCGFQWKYAKSSVGVSQLIIQNNNWGPPGTQCINADSRGFEMFDLDMVPNPGGLTGYPSVYKGCHWGNCTKDSGMPKKVSAITSLASDWAYKTVKDGIYTPAFDIWFHKTQPTPDLHQNDGAEIMIWLERKPNIWPVGGPGGKIATATINGEGWDVYYGPLTSPDKKVTWNVISYVRQKMDMSIYPYVWYQKDLSSFIKDAKTRKGIGGAPAVSDNWYLTSIQAGFEPYANASGLRNSWFDVTVK